VVGIRLPSFDNNCRTDHIAGSRYVNLQVFVGFRGHQGGRSSQILLQIFEGLLCLIGPLELVLFLNDFEERELLDAESRDESTQGSHTSSHLLDIMETRVALFW
jgi:hypothetical protein